MDLSFLKGIYVPILTPVRENEEVDVERLREHVNYIIDKGVHGILAHGLQIGRASCRERV